MSIGTSPWLLAIVALCIAPASSQTFEVASIKPCKDRLPSIADGRKGGNGNASVSPVTFNLPCQPVRFFINLAYVISTATPDRPPTGLEGGPAWIDSELYQISAKAPQAVSKDTMNGPMLRALLEERLHLQTHREIREVAAYALTVAKGGLKLKPSDLTNCVQPDPAQPSAPPGEKPWCGKLKAQKTSQLVRIDLAGGAMKDFARALALSDRMVIDRTGLNEKFDFSIEFAPDTAAVAENSAPSLESALGKLGLKLVPAKGARAFVVIDHVEKPAAP